MAVSAVTLAALIRKTTSDRVWSQITAKTRTRR